jgi:hypothetical protein
LTLAFLGELIAAAPTPATEPMRFAQAVVLPAPLEQEELVAVELDREVYAATRDGLPDLRVLDADGAELAFVLRQATVTKDRVDRRYWAAKKPTVALTDEGGVEITFELDEEDPAPQGLRLVTPLVDFERRVDVYSASEGAEWQPRVQSGLVYDYSQIFDARDDTLHLNKIEDAARHRRFRIVVGEVTQAQQSQLLELTRTIRGAAETERLEKTMIRRTPYRIDRIELWRETVRRSVAGPRLVDYPVDFASAAIVEKDGASTAIIGTGRQPIASLQIAVEDRNFSRAARVEVERTLPNGQSEWSALGSGSLSRLDFRDLRREQLSLDFSETRAERLRLVVENQDSPPLKISGIVARGPAYEAIVLAPPAAKLRLVYGSPVAEAPQLDASAVNALLAEDVKPLAATLGEQTALAEIATPRESLLARLLGSGLFLTIAVAVLVAVLALGLYRASKRVDQLPRD